MLVALRWLNSKGNVSNGFNGFNVFFSSHERSYFALTQLMKTNRLLIHFLSC